MTKKEMTDGLQLQKWNSYSVKKVRICCVVPMKKVSCKT